MRFELASTISWGWTQARNKLIGLPAPPESSRKIKNSTSYRLAAPRFSCPQAKSERLGGLDGSV
jgi:hypothetical protein